MYRDGSSRTTVGAVDGMPNFSRRIDGREGFYHVLAIFADEENVKSVTSSYLNLHAPSSTASIHFPAGCRQFFHPPRVIPHAKYLSLVCFIGRSGNLFGFAWISLFAERRRTS